MADQYVKLPDGSYAKFPDTMADTDIAKALQSSAIPERTPNSIGTFASYAWKQLNPIAVAESLTKMLTTDPRKTIGAIGQAQDVPRQKAQEAFAKGDYVTGARHAIDWLLPLVGPVLDEAADQSARGEVAAGAGTATGLALSMFGPEAFKQWKGSQQASNLAKGAEDTSTSIAAREMSPKGSSRQSLRIAKQATTVAPDVLAGTSAVTPEGLHQQVLGKLSDAADALDDAYKQIPGTQMVPTKPILTKLQAARDALNVQGAKGIYREGGPAFVYQNPSITPDVLKGRAAVLDQAITEVKALGPMANTPNLAQLRNAWGAAARDAFVPNVNPQFQSIKAGAQGWADAYSALQEGLTDRFPQLKPLNADYHIWKTAADVLDARADQLLAKPTVGRTMLARGLGAAAGGGTAGVPGALGGAVLAPWVESLITSKATPAMKLMTARGLNNLATALRSGQPGAVEQSLTLLRPLMAAHAATATAPALAPTAVPVAP